MRDYLQRQINEGFTALGLPRYMKDAVERYIFNGILPGGFLTAVLSNDLKGSVFRADHNNKQMIREWAEFVTWYIPARAQGSPEQVKEWKGYDNE